MRCAGAGGEGAGLSVLKVIALFLCAQRLAWLSVRQGVACMCAKLDVPPAPPCLQLGEVSAAAAAGLYFEERRALLSSLWLLLQAQVWAEQCAPSLPSPCCCPPSV